MLELRYVVENLEEVRAQLLRRGAEAAAPLATIGELAQERRRAITEVETMAQARNAGSAEMAKLPKGSPEFQSKREALGQLSNKIKELQKSVTDVEARIEEILLSVPNVPDAIVPTGKGSDDNPIVRTWGEKPTLTGFEPKAHWELGVELGILDFERASKISGPRFTFSCDMGARLSRALIQFMLELHTEHGYTEIAPRCSSKIRRCAAPVSSPSSRATLSRPRNPTLRRASISISSPPPKCRSPTFTLTKCSMSTSSPSASWLIRRAFAPRRGATGPTCVASFVSISSTRSNWCASRRPRLRGPNTRSSPRQAEEVLKRLGLHYRVAELCSGDLGAGARRNLDLEVWLPGQNQYREISSCSNFGDYQARRAQIKYRDEATKKLKLVHTLNGSALAMGRTIVAILEQFQQKDGSVVVPEVLRPWMKTEVLRKR